MSDDLNVLAPEAVTVEYCGKRLEVQPLTVGQIPHLVRKCRPVIDAVMAMETAPDIEDAGFVDWLLALVESHGENIYEGLAIAVAEPAGFIAKGNVAEFIDLAKAVFMVNRDFFVQRLGAHPGIRAAAAIGAGRTPSSS